MVLVGLSLTVAAVPESLPAVVTIALALGAHRMAQRHVVVRALPAVETLGSVTVVATDKTGTITEGRMTRAGRLGRRARASRPRVGLRPRRRRPCASDGTPPPDAAALRRLLRDVVLCNDADLVRDEAGSGRSSATRSRGPLLALAARGAVDADRDPGRSGRAPARTPSTTRRAP